MLTEKIFGTIVLIAVLASGPTAIGLEQPENFVLNAAGRVIEESECEDCHPIDCPSKENNCAEAIEINIKKDSGDMRGKIIINIDPLNSLMGSIESYQTLDIITGIVKFKGHTSTNNPFEGTIKSVVCPACRPLGFSDYSDFVPFPKPWNLELTITIGDYKFTKYYRVNGLVLLETQTY